MKQQLHAEISSALPGAEIEILSEDDVHFFVTVTWQDFKSLSMLEQHRKVYEALSDSTKEAVHALSLHTKAS